jgi:hypothetical protein
VFDAGDVGPGLGADSEELPEIAKIMKWRRAVGGATTITRLMRLRREGQEAYSHREEV